ncbi:MAG: hypothetical protein H0T79_06230 [Deltaproteobacteria bacterium]|nr:hypothetical protein [Deltaproteobacteria bacterium]
MRSLTVGVVLVGCGGPDFDSNDRVVDLTSSDQQLLCEDFLDLFCAHPDARGLCDDPCIMTGCVAAVADGTIDAQCAGSVTVGMVDDCATSGEFAVCVQGGGCMIDALEAVCP